MTLPADLAAAPAADEQTSVVFGKLSTSMQLYHAGNITAAKSAETRQRHIDKATSLFRSVPRRHAKVATPAHQAKSDIGRPLGHEHCRHRSPVRHNTG